MGSTEDSERSSTSTAAAAAAFRWTTIVDANRAVRAVPSATTTAKAAAAVAGAQP